MLETCIDNPKGSNPNKRSCFSVEGRTQIRGSESNSRSRNSPGRNLMCSRYVAYQSRGLERGGDNVTRPPPVYSLFRHYVLSLWVEPTQETLSRSRSRVSPGRNLMCNIVLTCDQSWSQEKRRLSSSQLLL